MLKLSEIKEMDVKSIDLKLASVRKELFNLRIQKGTSGVEKPHLFKTLKKDIARLLTVRKLKGE
ncbi:MAG: 50S ribosomal protein L29 [Halobacteriovoraceae bacterium]|nr:50S ribosomal protein L29 [Halobacteriovoraceae bacterium]